MKRLLTVVLAALFAAFVLAACEREPSGSVSGSAPASVSAGPDSALVSVPANPGSSTDAQTPALYNVDELAATLSEAANLGGTIQVTETDLKLAGVDVDSFEAFAGAESQLSAENGGIVVVIQAKPGAAAAVAAQLAGFRDSRMGNTDYAEFENARSNTSGARIREFGDYIVYAVSATGHEGGWDVLDAAIDTAFA